MKAQPQVTPEHLARLRSEDEQLRPALAAEIPAVREERREYVRSLTSVIAQHSREIDAYIESHGPLTHPQVFGACALEISGEKLAVWRSSLAAARVAKKPGPYKPCPLKWRAGNRTIPRPIYPMHDPPFRKDRHEYAT